MAIANCPSCGAPVRFRGAASIVAICEFCRSTLVRQGAALENVGTMAELIEDASPLQLGTEGRYKGLHFALIGRIQYRYASGSWNEWYCMFDDQRTGWLSDAMGNYLVTFLKRPKELPPLDAMQPGRRVNLDGKAFEVANIERAHVVAGAGELPFKVGVGWEGVFVDLRGDGGTFATIDYSETPPLLFAGAQAPVRVLQVPEPARWQVGRRCDRPGVRVSVSRLRCARSRSASRRPRRSPAEAAARWSTSPTPASRSSRA